MRRRDFIAGVGGAALAFPLRGRAQPIPTVSFLNSTTASLYQFNVAAFRQGLAEAGFVEGKNVNIEYRWAEGNYERLPELAKELVARNVAVIAATGDVASAKAAQAASPTTPVVFTIGADPVKFGLVASFNRPGAHVTGISLISSLIGAKRMEVLYQVAPRSLVSLLMNPNNPNAETEARDAQEAARTLGQCTLLLHVKSPSEFPDAFAKVVNEGADALFVGTDPILLAQREAFIRFAAEHKLPAIYFTREFAEAGGLISYGASIVFMYRQAGKYVGNILAGAKPAEMPVIQPTHIEMVVNLKTAKALGLDVPARLLALADEVVE